MQHTETAVLLAASGRGGPGRGQGMKPYFGEPMQKYQAKLAPAYRAFLAAAGNESAAMRALINWAAQNEEQLLEDPGPPEKYSRTTYPLTEEQAETATRLGGGNRNGGLRRIIRTAQELGLVDVQGLIEEEGEGEK